MTAPGAGLLPTLSAVQQVGDALDQVRDRASQIGAVISAWDILWILVVLATTYYVIRLVKFTLEALSGRLTRQRPLLLQLVAVARISLWILAIYVIVAGIVQPSRESLIALWATIGVGVGFAAQDVLKNVFGGLVILLDRPFKVGDLIDIGDHHGEVVSIGLRATLLLTRDDTIVAVPNAEVVSQPVLNANSGALDCMVVVELTVPSFSDPLVLRRIAREAAITSPFIYAAKPATVETREEIAGNRFLTRVIIRAYVYDHRLETLFRADVSARAKRGMMEAGLVSEDDLAGLRRTGRDPAVPAPAAAR
ncbi:MAG: mechanosensitive ion channel [Gemmatimonadetes bacterium]|nr:mechanosensitive ion channel [Gemmatimonadota bacterium]NIQ55837.1 mechanosensitive ion channel [Gemmatimonadota bacterium]NIU76039.1 mechanosensitive ion channel [Gammaproteobacteria bacterium]NIX45609.1 mechanosensitive ion channel [Gemmatimonadota bacterium]NIY09899.1 mechanosensitive ion channel [Gemmatimonadota bacterium]